MYNYLISSDDIEALNNKIEEIYKSFNLEFDVIRYDLEEDNIYNIIDELSTISLFDNPIFTYISESVVNSDPHSGQTFSSTETWRDFWTLPFLNCPSTTVDGLTDLRVIFHPP